MHLIFAPNKLRKAVNNHLPGQIEDPLELIKIDDEKEYAVEEILNSRRHRKKLQYRVK